MMAPLQRLIESLRNELQHYGEMLALLDQQRRSVQHQQVPAALETFAAIQAHQAALNRARRIRREARSGMARALGREGTLTVEALIPLLPLEVQPLMAALTEENRALQIQIRDRARQNQALLRQSADWMETFVESFNGQDTQWLRDTAGRGDSDPFHEAMA